MALQMNLTTPDQVTHTQAYINTSMQDPFIDHQNKVVTIPIMGWKNATARNGMSPADSILEFTAEVPTADFDTYFQESVLMERNKSPRVQAYAWIKTQSNLNGYDFTTSQDI